MKFRAIAKLRHYALVAALGWINTLVRTLQPLFPSMEMRRFSESELTQAWAWLEARPT